ncbi:MAG: hypothetical protein HWE22_19420 [Flavobacteriales bacterium]|nr:hypothetical protein [Flavobacteriales bacterium]
MLEVWDDWSEWKKLRWSIKREFRKQELKFAPSDHRYDNVLLIWLRFKFNSYSNEYLRKQLSLNEVCGDEPNLFPCPCCGFKTIDERAEYEICPVCWWEDDGQDNQNADISMGGPNEDISLTQARINYLKFGIYNPKLTDLIEKKSDTSKYIKGRTFQFNESGVIVEIGSNWKSSDK